MGEEAAFNLLAHTTDSIIHAITQAAPAVATAFLRVAVEESDKEQAQKAATNDS
jgi:hypothetical protein